MSKQEEAERRFEEFKAKQSQNKQHPMYQTSAHAIGTLPKGAKPEHKQPGSARPHSFTKTFLGGHFRDHGLNTAVSKSKVHHSLDGVI